MSHGEALLPLAHRFVASSKSLLALAAIVGAKLALSYFSDYPFHDNGLFGLGFLVVAGIAGGRLANLLGLPRLTGYLITGLLAGPSLFHIISESQVEQLRLVNGLALALIALHAGSEFTVDMLKKNLASLFWCSIVHTLVIATGIGFIFYSLISFLGLPHLATPTAVALALLYGTLAVSKSPAVVVAVLSEVKAKGALTDHALGMVVVLDIVVLVLFSVVLTLARSTTDPNLEFSLASLAPLGREVLISIAAGTFFGLFMTAYFWLINRERLLFIVATAYGVTALCSYLHYDTLLVFVVAGFVVTNFSKQTDKMIHSIESLSSITMIVFFATAGASLHLQDLLTIWPAVFVLAISRAGLTWISEWLGHTIAKSPPQVKKYGYTAFVPQAGLTIGLAMIVYDKLPSYGPQIATLAISVVTFNEIVGPVLFKWGLSRANEIPSEATQSY